jgi:hypothetical protein
MEPSLGMSTFLATTKGYYRFRQHQTQLIFDMITAALLGEDWAASYLAHVNGH